mgnify:FL=1
MKGTAIVDLDLAGEIQQKFWLPIGQHDYFIKSDQTECYFTINVFGMCNIDEINCVYLTTILPNS